MRVSCVFGPIAASCATSSAQVHITERMQQHMHRAVERGADAGVAAAPSSTAAAADTGARVMHDSNVADVQSSDYRITVQIIAC